MLINPDVLPDVESVIDSETGYAVNLPLGVQERSEFWEANLDIRDRLLAIREALGITVSPDFPSVPDELPKDREPTAPPIPNRPRSVGVANNIASDVKFARMLLETKKGVRHVRTPEGARRYGKPIGSPITRADIVAARMKNMGVKKTGSRRRGKGGKVTAPKLSNMTDAKKTRDIGELRKSMDLSDRSATREAMENAKTSVTHGYHARYGNVRDSGIPQIGWVIPKATSPDNLPDNEKKLVAYGMPGGGGRYDIFADKESGKIRANIYPSWRSTTESAFITGNAEDLDDVIEAANRMIGGKKARLTKQSDEYDIEGKWHRNRKPRDYEGLVERYAGVRGWDYEVVPGEGEINWKDYGERFNLAQSEAHELGYSFNDGLFNASRKGRFHIEAVEAINGTMRTHEDMYPGFANLIDNVVLSDPRKTSAIAWNGRTDAYTELGEKRSWNGLGFNADYFSTGKTAAARRTLSSKQFDASTGDVDGDAVFYAVPPSVLEKAYGWDELKALTVMTATHELGHTVGNILQNQYNRDGDPHNSLDKSVGYFHRKRMLEIFEDYGFLEKGKSEAAPSESQRWMEIGNKGFASTDPFDRSAITEHLGEYAATNVSEIMAETWAAYHLHPNPGDFVREMGELMEVALQDFLAEEDPSKRYKQKSVREGRAAAGIDAPVAKPDFKNESIGSFLTFGDFDSPIGKSRKELVSKNPPIIKYKRHLPTGGYTDVYMTWDDSNGGGWVQTPQEDLGVNV